MSNTRNKVCRDTNRRLSKEKWTFSQQKKGKIGKAYNEIYSHAKFISSSLWPPRRHSSVSCYPFSQEPPRSPTLPPEILSKRDPWGKTGEAKTTLTLFGRSVSHSCLQYLINRRLQCLNYGSKFILNNMNSCWQYMVTKLVKSLSWWPPFPKGFLRGTEFIHWVT